MPILPYILRKEQRFGTKLSRIRLIITLFVTSRHSRSPSFCKFCPLSVSPQFILVSLTSRCADYYYEKCIEFTKRLIYFITENIVTPSHPRQIYCFDLFFVKHSIMDCINNFFSAYHNFICISIN